MNIPTELKKLEIWLADESNLNYQYAFTRKKNQTMKFDTARKALELFIKTPGSERDLKVDFIGGNPIKDFDVLKQLQQVRENLEQKHERKLNFRVVAAGDLNIQQAKFFKDKKITLRSSLSSMEPTDAWWYDVKSDQDLPDPSMITKIPVIKNSFPDFQFRLIISRDNPAIKKRVEKLAEAGYKNIQLIPRLSRKCTPQDAPELTTAMQEFGQWFGTELIAGRVPTIVNARRMLFLIHRFNEDNPYPVKNHCINTNERVMLDVDGQFRTCRHFDVYPAWTLGNIEDGIYGRRISLYRYGQVIKHSCQRCVARFFCAGPCPTVSSVYAESRNYPMGYHCLFTKLLTETMEHIYNTLEVENPDILESALKEIGNPMGRIEE